MTYCSWELAQLYKLKMMHYEFAQTSVIKYSCDCKLTRKFLMCVLVRLWALVVLIFGNLSSVTLQSKQFLIWLNGVQAQWGLESLCALSGSLGELRLVLIHWCSKIFDLTSSESKVVKMFIFASKLIATRSCWPTYGLSMYEVRKPVASFEEKWSIIETKRGILSLQGECHLFQTMFPGTLTAGGEGSASGVGRYWLAPVLRPLLQWKCI